MARSKSNLHQGSKARDAKEIQTKITEIQTKKRIEIFVWISVIFVWMFPRFLRFWIDNPNKNFFVWTSGILIFILICPKASHMELHDFLNQYCRGIMNTKT
jgi:hypothetical protein